MYSCKSRCRVALIVLILLLLFQSPSMSQQFGGYNRVQDARSAWVANSTRVRHLISRAKAVAEAILKLKEERSISENELVTLRVERKRALEELRNGKFCSKCGRTASQIEREERVAFESHVISVQGYKRGPKPEEIKKVEDYYDRLINVLNEKIVRQEDEKRKLDTDCLNTGAELQTEIIKYFQNIDIESKMRIYEWDRERAALEKRLEQVMRDLASAELELAKNKEKQNECGSGDDHQQMGLLLANVQILTKQFSDSYRQAKADHKRADQAAATFSKLAFADIQSNRNLADTLGDGCWNATAFMISSSLKKSIFCYICPIKAYTGKTGAETDLRRLLESGDTPRVKAPQALPKESIRKLLEGK